MIGQEGRRRDRARIERAAPARSGVRRDEGKLATRADRLSHLVKETKPPSELEGEGRAAIVCGPKDGERNRPSDCVQRKDGAWLHFTLTVGHRRGLPLDLVAYDFELVFPLGHAPRFVRFDLNAPGHPNDFAGLRSHLHPGNDDLIVPAAKMHPLEILDIVLFAMDVAEKPRA